MNKKELLKEAKKRYPIGTCYENANGKIHKVENQEFALHFKGVRGEYGKGLLVDDDGIWAKIISLPKSEVELLEEKYNKREEKQKRLAAKIAEINSKNTYLKAAKAIDAISVSIRELHSNRTYQKLASTTAYTFLDLKELRGLMCVSDKEFEFIVNGLNRCGVNIKSAYELISIGLVN